MLRTLINLINKSIYLLKVYSIVGTHDVKGSNVQGSCLTDEYKQDVLPNLLLTDKVLIVHNRDLESAAIDMTLRVGISILWWKTFTELLELTLEVSV